MSFIELGYKKNMLQISEAYFFDFGYLTLSKLRIGAIL